MVNANNEMDSTDFSATDCPLESTISMSPILCKPTKNGVQSFKYKSYSLRQKPAFVNVNHLQNNNSMVEDFRKLVCKPVTVRLTRLADSELRRLTTKVLPKSVPLRRTPMKRPLFRFYGRGKKKRKTTVNTEECSKDCIQILTQIQSNEINKTIDNNVNKNIHTNVPDTNVKCVHSRQQVQVKAASKVQKSRNHEPCKKDLLKTVKQPIITLNRIDEVINKLAQSFAKTATNKQNHTAEQLTVTQNIAVNQTEKVGLMSTSKSDCSRNNQVDDNVSEADSDDLSQVRWISRKKRKLFCDSSDESDADQFREEISIQTKMLKLSSPQRVTAKTADKHIDEEENTTASKIASENSSFQLRMSPVSVCDPNELHGLSSEESVETGIVNDEALIENEDVNIENNKLNVEEPLVQQEEEDLDIENIEVDNREEQVNVENIRAKNKEDQINVENLRVKNKEERINVESIGAKNREERTHVESIRAKNREDQINVENTRAKNKEERINVEGIRAKNREERINVENMRAKNREERINVERIRAKKRKERINVESIGAKNREERINVENIREKNREERINFENVKAVEAQQEVNDKIEDVNVGDVDVDIENVESVDVGVENEDVDVENVDVDVENDDVDVEDENSLVCHGDMDVESKEIHAKSDEIDVEIAHTRCSLDASKNVDQVSTKNTTGDSASSLLPSEVNVVHTSRERTSSKPLDELVREAAKIRQHKWKRSISENEFTQKYKLRKQAKILLVDLQHIKSLCGNKYSATEVEKLTQRSIDVLPNCNSTCRNQNVLMPGVAYSENVVGRSKPDDNIAESNACSSESKSNVKSTHLNKSLCSENIITRKGIVGREKISNNVLKEAKLYKMMSDSTIGYSASPHLPQRSTIELGLSSVTESTTKTPPSSPRKSGHRSSATKDQLKDVSVGNHKTDAKKTKLIRVPLPSPTKSEKLTEKKDSSKSKESSNNYKCIVCDLYFEHYSVLQQHLSKHAKQQLPSSPSKYTVSERRSYVEEILQLPPLMPGRQALPQSPMGSATCQVTSPSDSIPDKNESLHKKLQKKLKPSKHKSSLSKKKVCKPCNLTNECSVCSQEFPTRADLAAHIFLHTESELQGAYAAAKQKKYEETGFAELETQRTKDTVVNAADSVEKSSANTNGCKASSKAQTTQNQNDQTSESAEVEVLEEVKETDPKPSKPTHGESNSNNQVSSVINKIEKAKTTKKSGSSKTLFMICQCHNRANVNFSCLQIEIVLLCHTCRVLFRSMECFETHYRLPKYSVCNQNRLESGRSPNLFCATCGMIFSSVQDVRQHLETHIRFKKNCTMDFRCNICKVMFVGIGSLFYLHWSKHMKDPFWVASDQSFPKMSLFNPKSNKQGVKYKLGEFVMNKYLDNYIYVAEYVCFNCKRVFINEDYLIAHLLNCRALKSQTALSDGTQIEQLKLHLICSLCEYPTFSRVELYAHMMDKHKFASEHQFVCVSLTTMETTFICSICMEISEGIDKFNEHWFSHYVKQPYFVCMYCNKESDSVDAFKEHAKEHELAIKHNILSCKVKYRDVEHICKICHVGVESKELLNEHNVIHNPSVLKNKQANEVITEKCILYTMLADKESDKEIEATEKQAAGCSKSGADLDKEKLINILEGNEEEDSENELVIDLAEHLEKESADKDRTKEKQVPPALLTSLPAPMLPVTTLPAPTLPVTTLPVTTLPVATLPVTTLPATMLPVTTLPVTTLPATTLPVTTLSTPTLPVTTLPVTTLAAPTLPVTTLAAPTLPVTTLAAPTLPVTTLAAPTLPVTTLAAPTLPVTTLAAPTLPVTTLAAPTLPVTTLAAPTLPAPALPAPTLPAPTLPAPTLLVTTFPAPTFPAPTFPAPTLPAPTLPAPTLPAPTLPAPTLPAPTLPAPTFSASTLSTTTLNVALDSGTLATPQNVAQSKEVIDVEDESKKDGDSIKEADASKPTKQKHGFLRVKALTELLEDTSSLFICQVCNYSCESAEYLRQHHLTHTTRPSQPEVPVFQQPARSNEQSGPINKTLPEKTFIATGRTVQIPLLSRLYPGTATNAKLNPAVSSAKNSMKTAYHKNLPPCNIVRKIIVRREAIQPNGNVPTTMERDSSSAQTIQTTSTIDSNSINQRGSVISSTNSNKNLSGNLPLTANMATVAASNYTNKTSSKHHSRNLWAHELPKYPQAHLKNEIAKKSHNMDGDVTRSNGNFTNGNQNYSQSQHSVQNQGRMNPPAAVYYQYPNSEHVYPGVGQSPMQSQQLMQQVPNHTVQRNLPPTIYYKNPTAGGMSIVINQAAPTMSNLPTMDIRQQQGQPQMYQPVYTNPVVSVDPYVQQPPQNFIDYSGTGEVHQVTPDEYRGPISENVTTYGRSLQPSTNLTCPYCPNNITFNDRDMFELHMSISHNFVCDICGLSFFNIDDIRIHKIKHRLMGN
ncbi:uncharacterized protein LOC143353860 [Halictus rubicundus]|uniref:uncharacterized protein LOC143353860 n=1 Tax=Halictus rubicundus TaxID=77578 RepID=UPI00403736A8